MSNISSVTCSWLARTDPADVARVESKTFICSEHERDVVPVARAGQKSALGNYISPADYDKAVIDRFPGCMRGEYRNLYKCYKGRKGYVLNRLVY